MVLFNVLGVVLNRLAVGYGNNELAAAGVVLKLERFPQNIALGVCLGMVPTVAYNYARKDYKRMDRFFFAAFVWVMAIGLISTALFYFLRESLVRIFIDNDEVVAIGSKLLKARSLSVPFMAFGFLIVNFMQSVNRGQHSFLLCIVRHIVLSIPLLIIFNAAWGMDGLVWSQLVADGVNAIVSLLVYIRVHKKITKDTASVQMGSNS